MSAAESKQAVLLESLRKFYADPGHLRVLTEVLRNESHISLRILDWLVTNYSKKRNVTYLVSGPDGVQESFNMFVQYKSQLKAYSKKHFDPFCRRERLNFADARGRDFETTVGQLNFFRWALVNGVIDYGVAHGHDIEDDMMQSIRHRYASPAAAAGGGPSRPKRKELSKAAIKTATRTMVKVTVRFT